MSHNRSRELSHHMSHKRAHDTCHTTWRGSVQPAGSNESNGGRELGSSLRASGSGE